MRVIKIIGLWIVIFIIGSSILFFIFGNVNTNPNPNPNPNYSWLGEIENNSVEYYEEKINTQKEIIQNKRSNKITYTVSEDCFSMTKNLIDKSFININSAMNNKLNFIKVDYNADITFNCYPYKYDSSPNYHYCDNEYCYTVPSASEETIGVSEGNLIDNNNSTISLYTGSMNLISIEHEIIHSLGYKGHNVWGYSVMSPYSDSSQEQHIDNDTINKLKVIYNESYCD